MMSGGKMSSREFEKCLCVAMRGSVPERMKLPGGQKWETAEQGKQFGNGRRRVHEQEKRLCDEQRKMAERGELLPGETVCMRRTATLARQETETCFGRHDDCSVMRETGLRSSFRKFLLLQIRFIGLRMWAVQTALFTALGSVLWVLMGRGFWQEERYVARFLCGLSLAASVSALPFIYRSFRYRMHETEASSRYSFAGVLLAKMLMTAMGDVVLLGAAFLGVFLRTELSVGSILLYLLLPFLLARWLSLSMMGRVSAAAFPAACMAAGAVLLVALGIAGRLWDGLYLQRLTPGWLAVCTVVALLCIRQVKRTVLDAVHPELRMA